MIHLARGNLASAFAKMPDRDAMFLVIGSALITGCFFTGQNLAYRGVHLIFVAAGFVAMRRAVDNCATRATLTRAVIIVVFSMWGIFFRQTLLQVSGSGPAALYGSLLLWLIREVLWWRLAALLLAMLVIFGVRSELFAALQQRLGLYRGD